MIRRRSGAIAAAATAAGWLLLHFLWFGGADPLLRVGELDLLLPARAILSGDSLGVVVGSVHGFQPGSYLEALLLAPLVAAFGEVAASRMVAAAAGAAAAAVVGGGAVALAGRRGWGAAAAAVVWPALHHECVSVWGSTPEAIAPALLGTLLLFEGGGMLAGGLLGFAWLFGPWGVAALGIGLIGARHRRPAALGAAAVVFAVACLPGGLDGVQAFLDKVMLAFAYPQAPGPGGWGPRLQALLGTFGGRRPGWAAVVPVLALLAALPALRGRRAAVLLWLPVLLAQGTVEPAPRYGLALFGALLVYAATLPVHAWALAAVAAPLGLLAPTPQRGPEDPTIVVGAHRLTRRLPVARATPRHAAALSLLPVVPEAQRPRVAFGYGAELGARIGEGFEPVAIEDWRVPERLLELLGPRGGAAFALGVGCGLSTLPVPPEEARAVFAPLDGLADWMAAGDDLCRGRPVGPLDRIGLPPAPQASVRGLIGLR